MLHLITDDGEIAMSCSQFDMNSENCGLAMGPMSRLNFSLTDQAEIFCEVQLNHCHSVLARSILNLPDVISLLDSRVMM
jgi:hypothetical protein